MTTAYGSDLCIVVRESGERTADVCAALLAKLLPSAILLRIAAGDFMTVMQTSLEAGLRSGRPWTLCIDADVLVLPDLHGILAEARSADPDVFAVQGLVHDKFMLCRRPAGNHLYRSELIQEALTVMPRIGTLRPETKLIQAMGIKGYGLLQSRTCIGLHDYEQAHIDIYAKASLHAHKHADLAQDLLPAWAALKDTDVDFRICLSAWADARNGKTTPTLARIDTAAVAERALFELELAPQAPLIGPPEVWRSRGLEDAIRIDVSGLALQRAFDAAVFPERSVYALLTNHGMCAARLVWRWCRILALLVRPVTRWT